jgi:hypothetical protein
MILWVVEMFERGKWLPTVGTSLTKRAGQIELRQWRDDNPDDRYRLVKYVREGR